MVKQFSLALDLFAESFRNVELQYRKIGETTVHTHRHIAWNMEDKFLAEHPGLLKHLGAKGKVTILVDSAVAEADVDTAEVRRELDETVAALRHPKTDEEFEELLDRRAWSESRLKLGGA